MNDIAPDVYARLAALETQVAFLYQHMNLAPPGPEPIHAGVPREILELVQSGNKLQAIKRHREIYGSSLGDAKDAIDSLG